MKCHFFKEDVMRKTGLVYCLAHVMIYAILSMPILAFAASGAKSGKGSVVGDTLFAILFIGFAIALVYGANKLRLWWLTFTIGTADGELFKDGLKWIGGAFAVLMMGGLISKLFS